MIQIDDAGSGSFVGGTCIGVYRLETNEYYFDIIPVELYNKENFKRKIYLDRVVDIVRTAFHLLDVYKNEPIEICRGYMFEKLRTWLDENLYQWKCEQITGKTQEVVEKNFELYTIKELGLPGQYIQYTKYPFHFHKLLRWVFADTEIRVPLCKIGWKAWEKVEGIIPEQFDITTHLSYLFCLKCGKHIEKGSRVSVLRFFSNKENYIYLHPGCHNAKGNLPVHGYSTEENFFARYIE